ncbi:hypothetical protein [Mesorhizobium japonicum]|nr:hypothetical protein [Mesorhizobium japonicum]
MPRDGSGVMSWPPNGNAVTATPIDSSKYNARFADLLSDLNAARPITAGGTGANTAIGGNDNLNTAGANIASASTVNLASATGVAVTITGVARINSFGTAAAGVERVLTFAGVLPLTYNATSMILPGAADIVTAVGDVGTFRSLGGGNWRCVSYETADGQPISSTFTSSQTFNAGLAANNSTGQAIGVLAGPAATATLFYGHALAGAGNAAFITLDRPGSFAANFGIDTDNKWKVGGFSMGANAYEIVHMGNYTTLLDPRYFQTANFASTLAGLAVGAVGTSALLGANPAADLSPGNTVAGSNLRFTHAGGFVGSGATAPSGTWRAMGNTTSAGFNTSAGATVFLRIS